MLAKKLKEQEELIIRKRTDKISVKSLAEKEDEENEKELKYLKWETFIKISTLASSSVFSSLIVSSLETINLIFAGKVEVYSEFSKMDILNAIGVGNIFINFGGFLFGLGMITSLETLCSQSYGKNNLKELSKWVKISNYFMTFYYILFCIFCLFSKNIIILLGQPIYIAELSKQYVYSFMPGFIIQFYMANYTKFLYAQQLYNPVLYINIICLLLHTFWCYLFYYILDLSIAGLGFAYDLTSLLMLLMITFYIKFNKLQRHVALSEITWNDCKLFCKMSLECGVLSSIDTLGFEIISIISSYLPQNQLDANVCVVNFYNNIYSISIGFATTLTTLVGFYMGENKPVIAFKYSKIGLILDLALTAVMSLCCFLFSRFIASLYVKNKRIIRISSKMIKIVAVFIIFDAMQLQLCGIIRGIGKQFLGMIIAVLIFIVFQTGLCLIFVFKFNYGVYGLWYAQVFCAIIATIVYLIILKYSDWNKLASEVSEIFENKNAITSEGDSIKNSNLNTNSINFYSDSDSDSGIDVNVEENNML